MALVAAAVAERRRADGAAPRDGARGPRRAAGRRSGRGRWAGSSTPSANAGHRRGDDPRRGGRLRPALHRGRQGARACSTAGKSGTAELGGEGEPHSWFIGFAPADAPTVAIAVIVEQGGRGGERAAPAGRPDAAGILRGAAMTTRRSRAAPAPAASGRPSRPRPRRPLVERVGMAAIAAVLATLFGGVAAALVRVGRAVPRRSWPRSGPS